MVKKFQKLITNCVFEKKENDYIPHYGNYTITYKKNFEDRGILPNGTPVKKENGRWVYA